MTGSSAEAGGEYVAPEQAVPRDKGSKTQVELLSTGEATKQYTVISCQADECQADEAASALAKSDPLCCAFHPFFCALHYVVDSIRGHFSRAPGNSPSRPVNSKFTQRTWVCNSRASY